MSAYRSCRGCASYTVSSCAVELALGVRVGWPDADVDTCPHWAAGDPRAGGCGHCKHLRGNRCRHPANGPEPLDYHVAREHGRPCGPRAVLWEAYA